MLDQAGYQYEPFSLEISEIIDENLNCFDQCISLACLKMEHFKESILEKDEDLRFKRFGFILTCDTMVEFQGESLGKPKDMAEAKKWIMSYSGSSQNVHTGLCLLKIGEDQKVLSQTSWGVTTQIHFKEFDEEAADFYLEKNEAVLDKAGAYGIQDEKMNLIERIEGSYTNVVGLPLESLSEKLSGEL